MRSLIVACFALCCAVSLIHADSIRLKNGRLDAGPVTVLALTKQQLLTARTKRVIVLTAEQHELLAKEAKVSPSVITLYSIKGASAGIHPCFEYNFGVWFQDRQVEIPHSYLVSDEEAAKHADDLDEMYGESTDGH